MNRKAVNERFSEQSATSFDELALFPVKLRDLENLFRSLVKEALEEARKFQANPPDRIIDTNELSREIGISLPTIIKYRKEGVIPYFRIGSRVRYRFAEVVKALEEFRLARKKGHTS